MLYVAIFIAPHTSPMNIRFPIENITDVSFVVQWDAVIDQSVDRYIVNWTDRTNPIQTVTVNETYISYNVTGLTPNTIYAVNIAAINKCGIGVPSINGKVTTNTSPSMNSVSTTSVFLRLIPTATTTTITSTASASTSTATHLMPNFNTTNPAACMTSKF